MPMMMDLQDDLDAVLEIEKNRKWKEKERRAMLTQQGKLTRRLFKSELRSRTLALQQDEMKSKVDELCTEVGKHQEERSRLAAKLSKANRTIDEQSKENMVIRLRDQEMDIKNLNEEVIKLKTRIRDLHKDRESQKLSLQESRFQVRELVTKVKLLEKEKSDLMKDKTDMKRKLTDAYGQRDALRQRGAIFKDRLEMVQKSTAPDMIKEKYETIIKDMQVRFSKQECQWRAQAQKTLFEREAAMSEKYRKMADCAISAAEQSAQAQQKQAGSELRDVRKRLAQLEKETIPIHIHEGLLQQERDLIKYQELKRHDAECIAQAERAKCTKAKQQLENVLIDFEAQSEKMRTEIAQRSGTIDLLKERILDGQEELSQSRLTITKLSSENERLGKSVDDMRKLCVEYVAKLKLASTEITAIKGQFDEEKSIADTKCNKLEKIIASLTAQVEMQGEALDDSKLQAELRIDDMKHQVAAARKQTESMRSQHEQTYATLQTMVPELKKAQIRQNHTDNELKEVSFTLQQRLLHSRSREESLESSLKHEREAHSACKNLLLRERQSVQELVRAKASLTDALETTRSALTRNVQKLESELAQSKQQFIEKENTYKVKLKRIEQAFRRIQDTRSPVPSAAAPPRPMQPTTEIEKVGKPGGYIQDGFQEEERKSIT